MMTNDQDVKKYKILIVFDVPGWAYHRRALALEKHAPDDFDVDITETKLALRHGIKNYQLVFNLDYMSRIYDRHIVSNRLKTILVTSHNRDSKSRLEHWSGSYDPTVKCGYLICNNREVWDFHKQLPRTCNISNGLDTDIWGCDTPIEDRPKRLLWCGSENPRKGKGWHDILRPEVNRLESLGYECDFRPFPTGGDLQSWAYTQERQREWYNGGFATMCCSEHEGTPNTTLEGMYCGCVPISTNVGNIREFGKDRENCVLFNRDGGLDFQAIGYAWDNRVELSENARETMGMWGYGEPGNRSAYFYQLFRRLIDDGPDSVEPFSYMDKHWSQI